MPKSSSSTDLCQKKLGNSFQTREEETGCEMNMTVNQTKADNTSPVTGIMNRTEKGDLERDEQMEQK